MTVAALAHAQSLSQNTAPATAAVASPPAIVTVPKGGTEPYGIALEGYAYPCAVHYLPLTWEGRALSMACMDVAPTAAPTATSCC